MAASMRDDRRVDATAMADGRSAPNGTPSGENATVEE
jgi:hypothetical protein